MKRLEMFTVNANCVEFVGFGARELHTEAFGRAPVWNSRTRRWVTSPRRVANLVALAEVRGYTVVLGQMHNVATRRGPSEPVDEVTSVDDIGQGLFTW